MSEDITRNYHGGNPQSVEANKRTRKSQDRARVLQHIWSCGRSGCTCYEAEIGRASCRERVFRVV